MDQPYSYIDIQSNNVLTNSKRSDINIWNQNLETSISFSKETNNDPKLFITHIKSSLGTNLIENLSIQFSNFDYTNDTNNILTNNFHMTSTSNFIIGEYID